MKFTKINASTASSDEIKQEIDRLLNMKKGSYAIQIGSEIYALRQELNQSRNGASKTIEEKRSDDGMADMVAIGVVIGMMS